MARSDKLPIIIGLAVAGVIACGVFIYFQISGGMSPEKPTGLVPTPPPETPPAAAPEPAFELPALDASNEIVRSLAETLSEHPRLTAWLAPDDLVRRFVAAVENVANDESPRPHVGHLKPEGAFRVEEQAGELAIDPESYARYDRFVAVLESLDDEGSLELYERLKPLFDQAYRDLGYPGGDFDVVLAEAIDRLLETPIPQGPVMVKQRVGTYRFVDPDLEALGPVEKHLIRMGPDNARKVKAKLRLLRASLPE